MRFCNTITVDNIPSGEFSGLIDFVHSFVEEGDDFSQIITKEKLTFLNFIYHCGSYTIQIGWDSQIRDDKVADEIRELFSRLAECKIDYSWDERVILDVL